jgi:hypothetical protein
MEVVSSGLQVEEVACLQKACAFLCALNVHYDYHDGLKSYGQALVGTICVHCRARAHHVGPAGEA